MSTHLHTLLNISASDFSSPVRRLENMTGNPGYDIRLTAEVIGRTQMTVRALGLDPKDSTAKEVYASLEHLLLLHNRFFSQHLSLSENANQDQIVDSVVHYIQKLNYPRTVYALKASIAKKFLKAVPPKRSMKLLGYRSVDSMLKREPAANILAVAMHTESKTWRKNYYAQYEGLRPIDFEERSTEIVHPTSRYWGRLGVALSKQLQSNVLIVQELGVVIVLPLPDQKWPATALTVFVLSLLAINEARIFSSFFKLQQVSEKFGQHVADAVTHCENMQTAIAGDKVHWRVVHGFFSGSNLKNEPVEMSAPHLTVEDFSLRKVEEVLANIEPAFHFWHGNEFVAGFFEGSDEPVSFNLLDVLINTSNQLPIERRIAINMRSALWDELVIRYLGSTNVRSIVLSELAGAGFELEPAVSSYQVSSDTL